MTYYPLYKMERMRNILIGYQESLADIMTATATHSSGDSGAEFDSFLADLRTDILKIEAQIDRERRF